MEADGGPIKKGGFYRDRRYATLQDLIEHYDSFLKLRLADREKRDSAALPEIPVCSR